MRLSLIQAVHYSVQVILTLVRGHILGQRDEELDITECDVIGDHPMSAH